MVKENAVDITSPNKNMTAVFNMLNLSGFSSSLILNNIMTNMPGNIYWKDTKGVYLGCNEQQAKFIGFQFPHEIVGKTDFELPLPKGSAQEFYDNDQRIIISGQAEMVEEKINEQGGTILSIKMPIKSDTGEVRGILGISVDISEKKREELREKEKEIAEKNAEVMNILSSSVAHEMRTPLSIIQISANLIQMLKVEEFIPSEQKKKNFLEKIGNICQAVKESSQVIDMLLVKLRKVITTTSPGKKKELLTLCTMHETIQQALTEYPFRQGEKVDYNQDVTFSYQGDVRLTKHILFNLIRNALYAIGEAQKGEIYIECESSEKFNCLIFRDTALGISEAYLPKIFDKFEMADEVHSGTGLGLAFCRLVMESFGGHIECRSELGQFTEFKLSFPKVAT